MKIIFTGGSGRFGKKFKSQTNLKNILYPTSKIFDITNYTSIEKYISQNKTDIIIHCAGLSRPMDIHEKEVNKSIDINIIGTANLVKICTEKKIKLIYFSTNYVYPGYKGKYKENDPLLPYNNYAWSKLGGECAVQMYKNSLILRICMTEKPFIHKFAFDDLITNFVFHDDVIKLFPKLIKKRGIINLGGPVQSVYKFAKKYNNKIKKISSRKLLKKKIPINHSMDINKLNDILK
ncbi:sugar nucleotide-binding protein [Candidatus Pelagibacter sp.]|jgi:dTDP-4-dehydrorhamnose reductase|nr:sugar nucleotide-binding protein [Candidatus Pelagibacter sp.]